MQGKKKAFIDSFGTFLFWSRWEVEGQYSEGLCGVWSQPETGYIDNEGKLVISLPNNLSVLMPFQNGLAEVWVGEGHTGHGSMKSSR